MTICSDNNLEVPGRRDMAINGEGETNYRKAGRPSRGHGTAQDPSVCAATCVVDDSRL